MFFKRIKSNFIVLYIKILSFKGISCSMFLIVYKQNIFFGFIAAKTLKCLASIKLRSMFD